jgi:hypothetical protein
MLLPNDFLNAYRLVVKAPWTVKPSLLILFAGQLITLISWITSSPQWNNRGILTFAAGFTLLMIDFFIRKNKQDQIDFHLRMIMAVFLTIIVSVALAVLIALVATGVGLYSGFETKLYIIGARTVGALSLSGFVAVLIRDWKSFSPNQEISDNTNDQQPAG